MATAAPSAPQAVYGLAEVYPRSVWHAPLVPVALAATAGVVCDRYAGVPLLVSLLAAVAGLAAWVAARRGKHPGLPLLYLWFAIAALAAAYHHARRDLYAPDDIGHFTAEEPRPVLVRGVLDEEPVVFHRPADDPLTSVSRPDSTLTVLRATSLKQRDDWAPASGRARLVVAGRLKDLHVGDEVEAVGWLERPHGPANPGEADHAEALRDQRIRAQVVVRKTPEGVTRLAEGWPGTLSGQLATVRGWGQRQLDEALPPEQGGLASALLLGEDSAMTRADWDKYMRTGVVHVLAISGQHLMVLAVFLWAVLKLFGLRRSRSACVVALGLVGYALLVGGRPPVVRAAVMVCAGCGGLVLRRPVLLANTFALAWLAVAAVNPTDLFNTGCQLSFLAVAVLFWGAWHPFRTPADPLDRLVEETRPAWQQLLLRTGRAVGNGYVASVLVWLAVAPLVAGRYHTVPLAAVALGPPLTLLTAAALITGFLLLLAAAVCPPLVAVFAWPTRWSLAGCDALVTFADRWRGGLWYVADVPEWWLWIFYASLLSFLLLEPLRRRWRWALLAGLGWLCVGLVSGAARSTPEELRCTFLAVGHGCCTVIETPDGRVLLYDAGANGGPDVARYQVAPFLWHRGVRRIDEVFLSHADLDHFNGLLTLLDRFAVGRVTYTPTFADKPTAGVRHTLEELGRRGVPVRVVKAGDRLTAGAVTIEVLHPPEVVPPSPKEDENSRSLVLRLRHGRHTLLLTGDLTKPGQERTLPWIDEPVDVLMAPHHGSATANTKELADKARPKVVVSSQEPPLNPPREPNPYLANGARYLETWRHGAVTVRSHGTGLVVETFRTRERFVVRGE